MENSTMSEEKENQLMREEPKTLSKKEIAALREAAKNLFKIQDGPKEPNSSFPEGKSSGERGRTGANPSR